MLVVSLREWTTTELVTMRRQLSVVSRCVRNYFTKLKQVQHDSSVIVALTDLPIGYCVGYSVIVALTGLPIGYSVIVALTDLPIGIGYSVIVTLTGLPIGYCVGYSVIVALTAL